MLIACPQFASQLEHPAPSRHSAPSRHPAGTQHVPAVGLPFVAPRRPPAYYGEFGVKAAVLLQPSHNPCRLLIVLDNVACHNLLDSSTQAPSMC